MKLQLSIVVMLLLSMTLFTPQLFAQKTSPSLSGSGTEADPYIIATLADLVSLSSGTVQYAFYSQVADIDASTLANYTPISNFSAIYDGGGHTISNLTINYPTTDQVGLFANIGWSGIIKNLGIVDATVTGRNSVGALTGNANTGQTFDNCYATGIVTGSGTNIGGLIGQVGQTSLSSCYSECTVSGVDNVGGLAGSSNSQAPFEYCYSTGDVYGSGTDIGGLVGENGNNAHHYCYSTSNVTGNTNVGGLIGSNGASGINVENCFARGDVYATGDNPNYFGGLFGTTNGGSNTANCFSTGAVVPNLDPKPTYTGGLIGYPQETEHNSYTTNCYWDVTTSGISDPNAYGATGLPTDEMLQQLEYNSWDFGGIWTMTPGVNGGYPYLANNPVSSAIFWTGASNSDFEDKDNWDKDSAPDETLNVVITSDGDQPILDATTDIECGNLTIEDGASLTIKSGGSIDVKGDLTIMSNTNGTGSLLVDGTCNVTGTVKAQRYLAKDVYHYVSSPLNTGTVTMKNTLNTAGDSYLGLTITDAYDAFFSWDEPTSYWLDLLHTWDGHTTSEMDNLTFNAGESYCYADGVSGNSGEDNTAVFEGTIRTSDVTFTASYSSGEGLGYHIVGNPFTSTLAINNTADSTNNFLSDNAAILDDEYEAIYVWDEGSAGANADWNDHYRVICNSGFAGVESGDDLGQNFVALGQGFMIRVNQSGNVVFNKSTQKIASAVNYYKAEKSTWSGVQLFAKSETANSSTLIGFNEAMTEGVDPSYDAGSMLSNSGANLYTLISGTDTKFANQSLPLNAESVICGIDVEVAGDFTFSIYDEDVSEVTLEDNITGEITSLKDGNSYTVYLEKGEFSDRFILHFKTTSAAVETVDSETGEVYANQNRIFFKNIEGEVQIIDMAGRVIRQLHIDDALYSTAFEGYATGVYVVKTEKKSFKITI